MKPINERLTSIEVSKNGGNWIYDNKTIVIWGHEDYKCYPIALVHKPKGISLEDWKIITDKIQIKMLK